MYISQRFQDLKNRIPKAWRYPKLVDKLKVRANEFPFMYFISPNDMQSDSSIYPEITEEQFQA